MVKVQYTQTLQVLSGLLELVKLKASDSKHEGLILVDYVDPDFGYAVMQFQQNTAQPTDKILWVDYDLESDEFKVHFTTREMAARYEHPHIGSHCRVWYNYQIFTLAKFIYQYMTDQSTHIDPLNGVG